jgi:hypothetical protein
MLFIVPIVEPDEAYISFETHASPETFIDWGALFATSLGSWSIFSSTAEVNTSSTENISDILSMFENIGDELLVRDTVYYSRMYKVFDVIKDSTPFNTPIEGFQNCSDFYKVR